MFGLDPQVVVVIVIVSVLLIVLLVGTVINATSNGYTPTF